MKVQRGQVTVPRSSDEAGRGAFDVGHVRRRYARIRKDDGTPVCERCLIADDPWLRAKGLLGRSELPADEGVLLRPASSIHMFLMRFSIDAVFLDRDLTVLKIASDLAPWRLAGMLRSRAVLEVSAGTCARRGLAVGDRLVIEP